MAKSTESKISEAENKISEIESVQKKIDEMLEKAEKTAKEIIDKAYAEKAGKEKKENDALPDEVRKEIERGEEYVEVRLFKDNEKYSDDVYVAVGNQNCVVKRGVPVKIKRKFYNVIKASEESDARTAQLIEREVSKYREAR